MSVILLPIKPEYADKIFSGVKKYEFRKLLAKSNVDKILVYSTYPVMKVTGEVDVIGTLSLSPSALWEKTKKEAGISRARFRSYFFGRKIGYAYKLGKATKYDVSHSLADYNIRKAPQSLIYITDNIH